MVVSAVSEQISVGTPTGVSVDLPEMVRRYEIRFMGRRFVVDLFVLGFQGFDVILGMDWLERHYVSLDCGRRQVVLSEPDRKSTRLNSSHITRSRMPSSA